MHFNFRRTLSLAIELGERAVEAQACYSLGNTYTLLRDFPIAIEYHMRHLSIAQELGDKVGEARACWSLGNAHSSIGNHENALQFAQQHYSLAKDVCPVSCFAIFCQNAHGHFPQFFQLGDTVGEATARMNVSDLRKMLGLPDIPDDDESAMGEISTNDADNVAQANVTRDSSGSSASRQIRVRRQSMEQLDLIKVFCLF